MKLYFVTYNVRDSRGVKKQAGDYLAVSNSRSDAERIAADMKGATGVVAKEVRL